jgi:hypothetical protein
MFFQHFIIILYQQKQQYANEYIYIYTYTHAYKVHTQRIYIHISHFRF